MSNKPNDSSKLPLNTLKACAYFADDDYPNPNELLVVVDVPRDATGCIPKRLQIVADVETGTISITRVTSNTYEKQTIESDFLKDSFEWIRTK